MSAARKSAAVIAAFLVIAFGNAVTHGALAGGMIEGVVNGIRPANAMPGGFLYLLIAWAMLAAATAYFVLRDREQTPRSAALSGAAVGILLDGGWNVVNRAQWIEWPLWFIAVDVSWHALHGAVAGLVVWRIVRRAARLEPGRG